ncbi:hypothetical protein VaNZ11_011676, partial [Volvox africanus]
MRGAAIWLALVLMIGVGTFCQGQRNDSAPSLYEIRLVGGRSPSEGRIEMFDGQDWGTICDHLFEDADAMVVCRQLGYATGVAIEHWGGGAGPILMAGVECDYIPGVVPQTLHQCYSVGWDGVANCRHEQDVGVRCQGRVNPPPVLTPAPPRPARGMPKLPLAPKLPPRTPPPRPRSPPPDAIPPAAAKYDVRLVGGDWPGEGRLEVFDGRQWGTVCDDGFSNLEATVACRQLGYDSGVMVPSDRVIQSWGMGTGRILLANVSCSQQPRTARLRSCAYQSWENTAYIDCYHTEDVGVRCYGKGTPRSPSPPVPPYPPVPSRWINVAAGRPVYASSVLAGDPAVSLCENAVCRPSYVTDGNVSNPLRVFHSDQYDY